MTEPVRCQFVSNDEQDCEEEADWVLRESSRGGRFRLPPWRNRVPFCDEHKEYLLTDPDVTIPWENQGRVDQFPRDSLYGYRDHDDEEDDEDG